MGYLKYYLSHFRSPLSLIRAPLAVLLITGLPSHAPAREQAGAEGDTATRLENIIVTATKRSRDLQGIIGAGMAVSGAEIEQRNLVTSEELFNNISGLQMQDYGGFSAQPTVMIRGVGADRPEYENSAQIVNDGLALGDSIMTHFPLFDVRQVEVLRGPQSTLYGKNALGGIVNIISRRPENRFEANAKVGGHTHRGINFGAALIGNRMLSRLSFVYDKGDIWLSRGSKQ